MDQVRARCRLHHRFRPDVSLAGDRAMILDRRQLLSGGLNADVSHLHPTVHVAHPAAHVSHHAKADPPAKRVGPAQEINTQYARFLAAFRLVEVSYVSTLNQTTTNTISVSATVTAAYAAGSPTLVVDDASVFGPAGTFSPAVTATAVVGGIPVGTFVLLGSSGNQLVIDVSKSSFIPLNPGAVITANVPVSAANSAAAIFPSYISSSTTQLAVTLLQYFNNLPIPLPRKYACAPPESPDRCNPAIRLPADRQRPVQQPEAGPPGHHPADHSGRRPPDLRRRCQFRGGNLPTPGARRSQATLCWQVPGCARDLQFDERHGHDLRQLIDRDFRDVIHRGMTSAVCPR